MSLLIFRLKCLTGESWNRLSWDDQELLSSSCVDSNNQHSSERVFEDLRRSPVEEK